MKISTTILFLIFNSSLVLAQQLIEIWQTDTLFKKPESVIYDEPTTTLFVANINGEDAEIDGNGFISKLGLDGEINNLKWVTGLNAPKGMGIYKQHLFVADINKIVEIDISSGKKVATYNATDAKFLNDITISPEGIIYVSDSHTSTIYKLENGVISKWLSDSSFLLPNGLLYVNGKLILADMDAGKLYAIDPSTKTYVNISSGSPKVDGINKIDNEYLISCWPGEVYETQGATCKKLLDTKSKSLNAADAWYIASKKLFLIPTFFGNTVTAYRVED